MSITFREFSKPASRFYDICNLDSDILGFPVARISASAVNDGSIKEVFEILKGEKVGIAYWALSSNELNMHRTVINENCGLYTAANITYSLDIEDPDPEKPDLPEKIGKLSEQPIDNQHKLFELARECNRYSHLNRNPGLPGFFADEMYTRWMENSLSGIEADEIFIATRREQTIGFVACSYFSHEFKIGLISVDRLERRKGWGTGLINSAITKAGENGLTKLKVITQIDNIPARNLYEKAGFKAVEINYIYHFWL